MIWGASSCNWIPYNNQPKSSHSHTSFHTQSNFANAPTLQQCILFQLDGIPEGYVRLMSFCTCLAMKCSSRACIELIKYGTSLIMLTSRPSTSLPDQQHPIVNCTISNFHPLSDYQKTTCVAFSFSVLDSRWIQNMKVYCVSNFNCHVHMYRKFFSFSNIILVSKCFQILLLCAKRHYDVLHSFSNKWTFAWTLHSSTLHRILCASRLAQSSFFSISPWNYQIQYL